MTDPKNPDREVFSTKECPMGHDMMVFASGRWYCTTSGCNYSEDDE